MRRRGTLPLGIDVGTTRIRVALCEVDSARRPSLVAVAARDRSSDLGADIADAVRELPTTERRCVLALGLPDAELRPMTFPPMKRREREAAARFEASRYIGYPATEAVVRVTPPEADGVSVVGTAPRALLECLTVAARRAKMRPTAVDHAALALRRVFPHSPVICDLGHNGVAIYARAAYVSSMRFAPVGGKDFTRAVADALSLDAESAERRKCSFGLTGCGQHLIDELVEHVASTLVEVRSSAIDEIDDIVLVGNGARLGAIAGAIGRATAIPTTAATLAPDVSSSLPPDVLRAAAPDWALAYGLALWGLTA